MADNGKTARSGGRESLRKVSISRIKKEMSDVFYLSDDLVIATLSAQNNTTADYPATIDGFSAIIMMAGEATVSIDMKTYQVRPNTIVFFNPNSIIRTIKCSSNAAAYFLAFSKSFVNEIQIDLSTSLPVYMRFGKAPLLPVTPQDVEEIRQLFQMIKTMLRSDKERYRHEIIRTLFTTAFYIITEINQREQPGEIKQAKKKEKISFGDLAYLVDFYSVLYNEPIISNKFMNTVRDIRNASAHSNCLINKLFEELPATQQPDAEIKDDWSYDKTGRLYFFGV